jgi:hypothetical protein
MSSTIVNAAPMTIFRGTDDQSTRALVPEPVAVPTHLPKIYIYAKKGPTTPQLVVGDSRVQMYHEDSFDLRKPYANHATVLSNIVNSQANQQMLQRVKPADAGPNSSLRLFIDVLPTMLPLYERAADGSFLLDEDGLKIPTGQTIAGYRVKFVADQVRPKIDGSDSFGQSGIVNGDQTDTTTGTQSQRYPIMDLRAPYFGSDGNNFGLRLWTANINSSSALDARIVQNEKVYPFRIACAYRPDELSTTRIVETLGAEQFLELCFRPGTVDRNNDSLLYIGDRFLQAYENLEGDRPTYGPFGEMKVYDAYIKQVLDLFYAAEMAHATPSDMSDFTGEDAEEYRFNLFGGSSSQGVPYFTYEIISGTGNALRLAETSTVFARGGSDGTMNDTAFASLVAQEVAEYANPNSPLMDSAKFPESIMYDSGFPLATKRALCKFIAIRKDTFVVLATHDVLGVELTASQETSMAIALRTMLQMFPESDYFGTPVMRGMVVGRSGRLLNSQYTRKLPLTLEIARKAAAYMGAADGSWKAGFAFDAAPLNQVNFFTDVNVTFTPASVRNKDWDAGLVWVQNYDRRSLFFPALKTVYDNDTSVLNSFFTALICCELQKVGERAWRNFTGTAQLTNSQLVERVNRFVTENTSGRFDGRVQVRPNTYFTEADIARGYSWSLNIDLYAPSMRTVMTLALTARRIEDLAPAA